MSVSAKWVVKTGVIIKRRNKLRVSLCRDCVFNRYNYPDELTANSEAGMPTNFCWYLLAVPYKKCLNKRTKDPQDKPKGPS